MSDAAEELAAERQALVEFWLQRARETLVEAETLAHSDYWYGAVNRIYYACFYAVTAVLRQHRLSSAKHTGVRSLFNRHLVHTGRVSEEFGEFYNELFDRRGQADYQENITFTGSHVLAWLVDARRFVPALAELAQSDTEMDV